MPKVVDHEKQREIFAEAATRLIAREGLEGLTMRAVAEEAQLSYGSLFHYFKSKEELLRLAVECSVRRQIASATAYGSKRPGLARLRRLLFDDAVVDAESCGGWVVWTAFVYQAAIKPELRSLHGEVIETWLAAIRRELEAAQAVGEIASDVDTDAESLALWVYCAGIGHRALLHPELLTPTRQRRLIDSYLRKLR